MSIWIRRSYQVKIRERLLFQADFHNQAFFLSFGSLNLPGMEQLQQCVVLPFCPELLLLLDPDIISLEPGLSLDGREPEQYLEADNNLIITVLLLFHSYNFHINSYSFSSRKV